MLNALFLLLSSSAKSTTAMSLLVWILVIVLVVVAVMYLVLRATAQAAHTQRLQGETHYIFPQNKPVSSIQGQAEVDLSIVIPAYNETERFPIMFKDLVAYVTSKESMTVEVIVVDDGSKDGTSELAARLGASTPNVDMNVLKLSKNRGKGGAVRMGVLGARGRLVLMADADGATEIKDLDRLLESMTNTERDGFGVVVGSRAHLEDEAVATRSLFRTILMYGFHFIVATLCVKGVRDTQCGFKLFTRKSAQVLFSALHIERWAFDVELLYLAQTYKMPIDEVSVNWQEIDGSKLDPLTAALQMARDIVRIRAHYLFGIWSA
eukprot:m.43679 g.43679  ORF g.43679 m.43679 type:complete len:322 (+) comp10787_c0_seq4:291-1256(+)